MKKIKRSYPKKDFRKYYRDLGLSDKNLWLNKETIFKIETYAARQSLKKGVRISFNNVVNEILDAKARELPEE